MMISRMIPPPTAVVIARIFTPKISIFFWMPAIAPDNAKAMVPEVNGSYFFVAFLFYAGCIFLLTYIDYRYII